MTKAQLKYRKKLQGVYMRRKILNPKRHIDRLFKSVYPCQYNDYIMIRYPKGYDAPVDAELYAVVRKLVKLGYHASGWDYGTYRKNGGFVMVAVNPTDKKQNTQKRLANSLSQLFSGDCWVHTKKPKEWSKIMIELTYFNNNAISINFSEKALKQIMDGLQVKPSKAQVLPGAKSAKIPDTLAQHMWDELMGDKEVEPEDMF